MRGWCGNALEFGTNWVMFDLKAPTVIKGFKTQGVLKGPNKFAFSTAIRIQVSQVSITKKLSTGVAVVYVLH